MIGLKYRTLICLLLCTLSLPRLISQTVADEQQKSGLAGQLTGADSVQNAELTQSDPANEINSESLQQVRNELADIERQVEQAQNAFDDEIDTLANSGIADEELLDAYQQLVKPYLVKRNLLEQRRKVLKELEKQLIDETEVPDDSMNIESETNATPLAVPSPDNPSTAAKPTARSTSPTVGTPARASGPVGSAASNTGTGGTRQGGPRVRPTPLIAPRSSRAIQDANEVAERDQPVSAADRKALLERAERLKRRTANHRSGRDRNPVDPSSVEQPGAGSNSPTNTSPADVAAESTDERELDQYRQQLKDAGVNDPAELERLVDEKRNSLRGAREAQREVLDALNKAMEKQAFMMVAEELPPLTAGAVFEFEITGRARLEETKENADKATRMLANYKKLSARWRMSSMILPRMKALREGLGGIDSMRYRVNRVLTDTSNTGHSADPIRLAYYQNASNTLRAMRQVIDGSLLLYQNDSKPTFTSFDGSRVNWESTTLPQANGDVASRTTIEIQGISPDQTPVRIKAASIQLIQMPPSLLHSIRKGINEFSSIQFTLSADDRSLVEKLGELGERFFQTLDSVMGQESLEKIAIGSDHGWCQFEIAPHSLNYFPVQWLGTRTKIDDSLPEPIVENIDHQTTLDRLVGNLSLGTGPIEPAFGLIGKNSLLLGNESEQNLRDSMTSLATTADTDSRRTPSGLSIRQAWTRSQSGDVELLFSGGAKGKQWNHEYVFTWTLTPKSTSGSARIGSDQK